MPQLKNPLLETDYNADTYVRLIKLRRRLPCECVGSDARTANDNTEPAEGEIIAPGYVVDGWFLEDPVIGKPFVMLRFRRNTVNRVGVFFSSYVTYISDREIWTENSIYVRECRSFELERSQ